MLAYAVLRNQELEPHRGGSLWIRTTICGAVFALLWGVYFLIKVQLFEGDVELFHLVFIVPALAGIGGFAAMASLDLDYFSGVLHYGFYLTVTVMLRLLMGLPPF